MATDDQNQNPQNQVVKSDNFDINLNLDAAPKVEETNPVEVANPVPEEKMDLTIDFPKQEEIKVDTPEIKVDVPEVKVDVPEVKVDETVNNDRLKVEDEKNKVEVVEEKKEIPSETKTAPDKASLEKDMKIIEEITGNKIESKPEVKVDETPVEIKSEPQTVNLDNLFGATPAPVVEPTPVVVTNPVPEVKAPEIKTEEIKVVGEEKIVPEVISVVNVNPAPVVDQNQNYFQQQPNIATNAVGANASEQAILNTNITHKNSTKKIVEFASLFLGLGVVVFFVLKTMYPIEFHNIAGNEAIQTGEVMSGEILSGDILSGDVISGDVINSTGIEMLGLDGGSDFNAFQDLEAAMTGTNSTITEPDPTQAQMTKLQRYQTEGKKFMDMGNTMKDKVMLKYGSFIYLKSSRFIQSIENVEQIDNLSGYFAQFDEYLARLQNLLDESLQTETVSPDLTTTPDDTTGTTDITQEATGDQVIAQ